MEIAVYTFMIFYIYSFVGYFIEVFWIFLSSKKLVNRGFLCGPTIPIYGIGALLILICLMRYYNDPVVVFVFGVIITSALEYFVSFLLEKIFCNKWWDYSNTKYNINGRICLRNSFLFGVLALFIVYIGTPLIFILLDAVSFKFWLILSIILFILLVLDIIYSVVIAYNLRNRIIIVEELKNEKIAMIPVIFEKRLKESIKEFKAFPNRLLKAFPYLENQYHKSFELMRVFKEQVKSEKKRIKDMKNKNKKKKVN